MSFYIVTVWCSQGLNKDIYVLNKSTLSHICYIFKFHRHRWITGSVNMAELDPQLKNNNVNLSMSITHVTSMQYHQWIWLFFYGTLFRIRHLTFLFLTIIYSWTSEVHLHVIRRQNVQKCLHCLSLLIPRGICCSTNKH